MGVIEKWERMGETPACRYVQIALVCTLYMVIGPGLILLNKYILKVRAACVLLMCMLSDDLD